MIAAFALAAAAAPTTQAGVDGEANSRAASKPRSPFVPDPAYAQPGAGRTRAESRKAATAAPPEMILRGMIKIAGKDRAAAMIEFKGDGTRFVHEGDKLNIRAAASGAASAPASRALIPVQIIKIETAAVSVEICATGEIIIVR